MDVIDQLINKQQMIASHVYASIIQYSIDVCSETKTLLFKINDKTNEPNPIVRTEH